MEINRIRTNSASTAGGGRDRAISVFSEGYQTATTAPTSPATSSPDYSSADDEIFEIDKDTFNKNTEHIRKDSCQSEKPARTSIVDDEVKFINGSTLGGTDPLHSYIRAYNMEPKWWTEERQREERRSARPPTTKRKRSTNSVLPTYLDPTWYDALPYSRQDAFTSGLDMEADPEVTSEQFWGKVLRAWKLSMRFESVEERREGFEVEVFEVGTPEVGEERGEFRQEWFKEELTVGETW